MKNSSSIPAMSMGAGYSKPLLAVLIVSLLCIESAAAGCLKASPLLLERKAASHAAAIKLAANKHRIDRELILAVIAVESCFQRKAVSPAGAEGLMQLMPDTADRFGVTNSFNAKQNVMAGSKYLKWLLKRFGGNLKFALAGYNAGEGRVDQYKGIPPFRETQKYVKNVIAIYNRLAPQKAIRQTKTIANGTVYYPYKPLKKKTELVGSSFATPVVQQPEALTAKPGRQGLDFMKSRAPHLYRKP
jgi:soluble lytic murein transglycosylase-like protein